MIRIGLIGPGRIADRYLAPAIGATDGAELWTVLSRDPARAATFAARHGAAAPDPAPRDLAAMLADPALDAVLIASPDKLHADQAIAAARAGKHVLCEKPMATSPAEARAMVDAAGAAGVVLGVAYHLRWHAGHRALAEQLRAGALGDLFHARIAWTFEAPSATNWRAHPEVGRWWSLAGVGTHCVDLVRWLMQGCGEVVGVGSAIGQPRWKTGHDETAVVGLRFASGATAEILTSVLLSAPRRVEMWGAQGAAVCDDTLGPAGAGSITVDGAALAFDPVDPYAGEIADFVRAIGSGGACEVPGDEGLRNVEILTEACP